MRLKKQTDYSLRVLMYVASHGPDSCRIKEIADSYQISQNHLMKVVQNLAHLGYLKSARGKNGGLWMGMPPAQISLGKLLRHMEEQDEVAECFVDAGSCKVAPICGLKHALKKAETAFFETLDKISLADILSNPEEMVRLLRIEA